METTTLHPLEFVGDEIEVADALLVLKSSATSLEGLPRWGRTQRRSNPRDDRPSKEGVQRLSPSTPLSFSPSSGRDETPPPPPLPPPPPPAAVPSLPPRPPPGGGKIYRKFEQHKEWVKEQKQMIAALSATKATLLQRILEAKRRCQRLSETNSWLKEMQSEMRGTITRRRLQQQRQRQLCEMRSRGGELDLFPLGPTLAAVGAHQRQILSQRQVDLNRRAAEEAAAEWQRQAWAQARKRRIELQRVKSSLKIQRLR